jgi:hypothetical protein
MAHRETPTSPLTLFWQAIFATGDITNTAEISELYNINPAPDNVVDLLRALYDAVCSQLEPLSSFIFWLKNQLQHAYIVVPLIQD